MATGGTIPANRTQSVRFYNTCGVVDKDKNVYLSPRFTSNSVIGKKVNVAYLEALEAVCPPSSAYKDIAISGWSPQDRTLVVRGNIDDFRLVTEEGACLNYLIVTRSVTKGLVTKTYYYGFFITGVEQSGGSSVRLTLEPDDFTNVFYLHNEYVMTNIGYEPFNDRMKNCHVNRQHYDRISVTSHYTVWFHFYEVPAGISLAIGQPIGFNSGLYPTMLEGVVEDYNDSHYDLDEELAIKVKFDNKVLEDVEGQDWCQIIYGGNVYDCMQSRGAEWNVVIDSTTPANLKIFLNQEESFKFKYQYRDYRSPFSADSYFTKQELNTISVTDSINSLSASLRKKVLIASIQYLVVELKSPEKLLQRIECWRYDPFGTETEPAFGTFTIHPYSKLDNFIKGTVSIFRPFLNVPDSLSKYESEIKQYALEAKYINGESTATIGINASGLYNAINKNAFGDFVLGAYIVNDICVPDSFITIDSENHKVYYSVYNGKDPDWSKDGLYAVPYDNNARGEPERFYQTKFSYIYQSSTEHTNNVIKSVTAGTPVNPSSAVSVALLMNGYFKRNLEVNMSEEYIDLKSNYDDPVLNAEPYSFYSLSYLTYEMPFNKNRYYVLGKVDLLYNFSVNGAVKIGYIPRYQVEGKSFKYFNESLTFTLPDNLPFISDSYMSYYYQNQAQMKNQFAVNTFSRGIDLLQHFAISGPNKTGQSAFRRGGAGALSEAINQSAQMLDEIADYAQSNKEIEMNQKAKLADMGAKPDVVKQAGSDAFYDIVSKENRPFVNHYTIDEASYNSIAKFLERFGYQINLYDTLHVMDRVGWNYIKTNSFDWNPDYDIMVEQEENLIKIFSKGVTLLHNKAYLTSGHNYETILDS